MDQETRTNSTASSRTVLGMSKNSSDLSVDWMEALDHQDPIIHTYVMWLKKSKATMCSTLLELWEVWGLNLLFGNSDPVFSHVEQLDDGVWHFVYFLIQCCGSLPAYNYLLPYFDYLLINLVVQKGGV